MTTFPTELAGREAGAPSAGRWMLGTVAVWLPAVAIGVFFWGFLNHNLHGIDSHAYWLTARHAHLYSAPPGGGDAYLYSPAFAQAIWPIAMLPWPTFATIWTLSEAAAFTWLLAPLGLRWGVPAFLLCLCELSIGNVFAFFSLVVVLGLRYPAAWALPLLTKLTPGLGPLWFAARREWRSFAVALGSTIAIVTASFVAAHGDWIEWVRFLSSQQGSGQALLPVRVAAGALLTVIAARRDRAWLLVPAMLLANPMMHEVYSFTMLAALPRLVRHDRSLRSAAETSAG